MGRKPTVIKKSLSKQKINILGHCLFDGSVGYGGVKYTNSSLDLVNNFVKSMKEEYGVLPDKFIKRCKKSVWYEVSYYNTNIMEDLYKWMTTFSTNSYNASISKELFLLDEGYIREFLRTFWEDEGYITCKGEVQGKLKSERVIRELIDLHKKIGIECNFFVDNFDDAFGLRLSLKKPNIIKFYKKIGFGEAIVTRGNFINKKKTNVLKSIYPFLSA